MKCNRYHELIEFSGKYCPLCELLHKYADLLKKLEDQTLFLEYLKEIQKDVSSIKDLLN